MFKKKDLIKSIISLIICIIYFFNNTLYVDAALTNKTIEDSSFNIEKIIEQSTPTLKKRKIENVPDIITCEKEEKVDSEYILNALNLLVPYVYKITGITENFRLYNFNTNKITMNKKTSQFIENRAYNQDFNDGSVNVMRCLFPSSSGTLNSSGGSKRVSIFTEDCNPSPELIAKIIGFIYNNIRTCENFPESKLNDDLTKIHKSKKSKISFLQEYLDNNLLIKSKKEISSLFDLIKNIVYMIQNEESDKENPTEEDITLGKALPKYTTEHMIMGYFIEHFNSKEEVDIFYNSIKNIIKTKETSKGTNIENSLEKLKHLKYLINKSRVSCDLPYFSNPVSNGRTKSALRLNKKSELIFIDNYDFQDCVETTVRNTLNLLFFSNESGIDFIMKDANKEKLNSELIKLKEAIINNKTFEIKSLKERLQLFYLYQDKELINSGDIVTRTLWNYVISNMDNETKNTYSIEYEKDGNGMETGLLNLIKVFYNIAYALKGKEKCTDIKFEIDKIHNEEANDKQLECLLKKTLQILNPNIKINDKNDSECSLNDKMINIDIKLKERDLSFIISQNDYHSCIFFSPFEKIDLSESDKLILLDDEISRLLISKVNQDNSLNLSFFHSLYSGKEINITNKYDTYINKYKILKFLKDIEDYLIGTISNNMEETIIFSNMISNRLNDEIKKDSNFLSTAKLIFLKENRTLFDYIFDNYIVLKIKDIEDEPLAIIKQIAPERFKEKDDYKYILKSDNTLELYLGNVKNKVLNIPNNVDGYEVTSLGYYSISGNLNSVNIPTSIVNIKTGAFTSCYGVIDITAPNVVFQNEILFLFYNCAIRSVKILNDVKTISNNTFLNCNSLISITIPESVTHIENHAFDNCARLNKITVKSNYLFNKLKNEYFNSHIKIILDKS